MKQFRAIQNNEIYLHISPHCCTKYYAVESHENHIRDTHKDFAKKFTVLL